ncbi:hypothetical protein [Methylocaldum gracile]
MSTLTATGLRHPTHWTDRLPANRARSGIPWGVTPPDPAPTLPSAGTRPPELKRSIDSGEAAPGVPRAALESQRTAPLTAKPQGDDKKPTAYRCDRCGTVVRWSSRPGPEGGLGFCDCGADPLAWYPVRPKFPEPAPARLASVRYRLKDGSAGSIVGAFPVSELLEDLQRIYGDRLASVEPRRPEPDSPSSPDFNDGLAAPVTARSPDKQRRQP